MAVICGASGAAAAVEPEPWWRIDRPVVLADGLPISSTATPDQAQAIKQAASAPGPKRAVTIDYPSNESVFPPEMVAPTFLWHDESEARAWLFDVALPDGRPHVYVLTPGPRAQSGPLDERCIVASPDNTYELTPHQASARTWTPDEDLWNLIKKRSTASAVTVTIRGLSPETEGLVVSEGRMRLTTSRDPVGAPIFYRDVPLMPSETEPGVIKPLHPEATPLIAWRLRDIAQSSARVVLRNLATCANCHSFSKDGHRLGMDMDGPDGDKGAYALADVARQMMITKDQIITWNSFPEKPPGHKTIGFMSRVSPDGEYVVSTVNEEVYVANFRNYRFLQVFYPTRGILAWYSRSTGKMMALPGADDPVYVHCDPVWTPDGKTIVFARAGARDPYPNEQRAAYAGDPLETPIQYDLYRIAFNGGRGGKPEPIKGAFANGKSNSFPKVSPDGRWIVFVQCQNGQLMRPDSRLHIVPFAGGEARSMRCNTSRMNSWHSFSPNGKWMVFSSKANTPYTQMFLTHIDEAGNDSPAILIPNATAANRAVNLPEFLNIEPDGIESIAAPAVEYYRHFKKGRELVSEGRHDEAEGEFLKSLEMDADQPRTREALGSTLAKLRKYDEALAQLEKALELRPDYMKAHETLGALLASLGRNEDAIVHFQKMTALDPEYAPAHNNLGLLVAQQGDLESALAHYNEALKLDPDFAQVFNNLGIVQETQGQAEQAIKSYSEALRLEPHYIQAYNNLVRLLARRGSFKEVETHSRTAIFAQPAYAQAYHNLGVALEMQGQLEEAIASYREALTRAPDLAPAQQSLDRALKKRAEL